MNIFSLRLDFYQIHQDNSLMDRFPCCHNSSKNNPMVVAAVKYETQLIRHRMKIFEYLLCRADDSNQVLMVQTSVHDPNR